MTEQQLTILKEGRFFRGRIFLTIVVTGLIVVFKTDSLAWGFVCALALTIIREAPTACVLDRLDVIRHQEMQQIEGERNGTDAAFWVDNK